MSQQDHERDYTVEFIRKRGPEQVARDTGLNRQTVRQIVNGRNGPGRKVIAALTTTYPEYDIKKELYGTEIDRRPAVAEEPTSSSAMEKLIAENARLRLEIEYLRSERDKSEEEKAKYWKLLESMHTSQQDFSEVSSQTTSELLFPIPSPSKTTQPKRFDQYNITGKKKPVTWSIPGMMNLDDAVKE